MLKEQRKRKSLIEVLLNCTPYINDIISHYHKKRNGKEIKKEIGNLNKKCFIDVIDVTNLDQDVLLEVNGIYVGIVSREKKPGSIVQTEKIKKDEKNIYLWTCIYFDF